MCHFPSTPPLQPPPPYLHLNLHPFTTSFFLLDPLHCRSTSNGCTPLYILREFTSRQYIFDSNTLKTPSPSHFLGIVASLSGSISQGASRFLRAYWGACLTR